MKLDDLAAVHYPGCEKPREDSACPTNPVKALIGGHFRGGHEFDPCDAVIHHDGEWSFRRPLAAEEEYLGKAAIPRIGQFDVPATRLQDASSSRRFLAIIAAGRPGDLHLHESLGGEANHLPQNIGVERLFPRAREGSSSDRSSVVTWSR
jgi:hypothetical protein